MATTEELFSELTRTEDIAEFLEKHKGDFVQMSPSEYLCSLLEFSKLNIAEVARAANLGDYAYKIFHGERKASRDILLAISFALHATLSETQLLLRLAKYQILDPKDARDAVLIFGVQNRKSLMEIDTMLYELHQEPLTQEKGQAEQKGDSAQ